MRGHDGVVQHGLKDAGGAARGETATPGQPGSVPSFSVPSIPANTASCTDSQTGSAWNWPVSDPVRRGASGEAPEQGPAAAARVRPAAAARGRPLPSAAVRRRPRLERSP